MATYHGALPPSTTGLRQDMPPAGGFKRPVNFPSEG